MQQWLNFTYGMHGNVRYVYLIRNNVLYVHIYTWHGTMSNIHTWHRKMSDIYTWQETMYNIYTWYGTCLLLGMDQYVIFIYLAWNNVLIYIYLTRDVVRKFKLGMKQCLFFVFSIDWCPKKKLFLLPCSRTPSQDFYLAGCRDSNPSCCDRSQVCELHTSLRQILFTWHRTILATVSNSIMFTVNSFFLNTKY